MSELRYAQAPAVASLQRRPAAPRGSTPLARRLGQALEGAAARSALTLSAIFPVAAASAVGGRLARTIGPLLPVSGRARRNLRRVFPERSPQQLEQIVRAMWDNLGRTAAEYAHIGKLAARIEVVGAEHVARALDRALPIIFFGAHLGNWEIAPSIMAQLGAPLHLIYRPVNNRAVNGILQRLRRQGAIAGMIPRGREGAREAMRLLASGEHLGMLIDQKVKRGLAVPFLGHDALTTRALAHLALRFDCAVLPVRVERIGGVRFRLTIYPALNIDSGGDRATAMRGIVMRANAMIEDWIRQQPEHWLWLHRRWPD